MRGGAGNDSFYDNEGADSFIGNGGNDYFQLVDYGDLPDVFSGGAGQDTYQLYAYNGTSAFPSEITDFQAGIGGDVIEMSNTVSYFQNWNYSTNPFLGEFIQLVDDGSGNTLLRVDYDGAGASYAMHTILKLDGVAAASFTRDNFSPSWSPTSNTGIVIIDDDIGHTLNGTGDGDTIIGNGGNEAINPSYGADSVTGDGGDDNISADHGDDTVLAGTGNDTVNAGEGNDSVDGGDGNDYLQANGGNDTISAEPVTTR